MSMKKWRQLVNEKAEVEQQNESILAAIKNNKINEELGQLSGEKLFKPITSRLDRRQEETAPEEQVPDYGMDEFDLNNPFDEDFKPDEETPTPSPTPRQHHHQHQHQHHHHHQHQHRYHLWLKRKKRNYWKKVGQPPHQR